MAEYYSVVCIFHILSIHLLIDAYLGYCKECHQALGGCIVSFQISVFIFFGYIPNNGIVGSYSKQPISESSRAESNFSYRYPHSSLIFAFNIVKNYRGLMIRYPTDSYIFYIFLQLLLQISICLAYFHLYGDFSEWYLQIPRTHTLLDPRVGHPDHAKQN